MFSGRLLWQILPGHFTQFQNKTDYLTTAMDNMCHLITSHSYSALLTVQVLIQVKWWSFSLGREGGFYSVPCSVKNCSTCRAPEKCGMLLNEFESAEKDMTFLFSSTLSLTEVWVGCFAAFLVNCWMLPRQPNSPWSGRVFIMKTESVDKPCWCRFTNFHFPFFS